MLGVIIQGAIRNVTVSVKMGVSGMPWAWERRGTPWSHTGCRPEVPVSLFSGETNSGTFTEHLLCAGHCAKYCLYMRYPSFSDRETKSQNGRVTWLGFLRTHSHSYSPRQSSQVRAGDIHGRAQEACGSHLRHILQQTDVDGNQARETLVGETEAFHEEQQLRRAARVLDHVVELLPAQDVDVALAEERVCGGWGGGQWSHVRTLSHQEVRELSDGDKGQSDLSFRHREKSTDGKHKMLLQAGQHRGLGTRCACWLPASSSGK